MGFFVAARLGFDRHGDGCLGGDHHILDSEINVVESLTAGGAFLFEGGENHVDTIRRGRGGGMDLDRDHLSPVYPMSGTA